MKLLLVNTYDTGGAANSCKRLHLGLLEAGIESSVLLKNKQINWPQSHKFQRAEKRQGLQQKLKGKIKKIVLELKSYNRKKIADSKGGFLINRQTGLEMFSYPYSDLDITQSPLYKEADLINLHWVANFLDLESFFKKNTKPVVWTLHDMNPFSGGEHYEEIYLGIDDVGFPVKREISAEEKKAAAENIRIKRKALSRVENLTIAAPSKWLADEAAKSEVFKGKEIVHIPYGLEPGIFSPKGRDKSRDFFNIPKDKKVTLFVSDSINKNRKGFAFLKNAFEELEGGDFLLCAVGEVEEKWEMGKSTICLGTITEEEHMCMAYSAADVFVIPSLMDNLPNTVLESLMCGTPVIGFPVGGIPEMIMNGKNGLITEEISVSSLHKTILHFFDSIENYNRKEIRENAIEQYNLDIQVKRYISVYQEILDKKNGE